FLFALATNGQVLVNTKTLATDWSGWKPVPGGFVGTQGLAAAVVFQSSSHTSDALELYGRGTNRSLYLHRGIYQTDTQQTKWWDVWQSVPGNMITTHAPAAVGYPNDGGTELALLARGTDGQIYVQYRINYTWSGWNSYGMSTTAAPSGVEANLNTWVV